MHYNRSREGGTTVIAPDALVAKAHSVNEHGSRMALRRVECFLRFLMSRKKFYGYRRLLDSAYASMSRSEGCKNVIAKIFKFVYND